MKICIYMPREVEEIKRKVENVLAQNNVSYSFLTEKKKGECDIIFIVGKDGDVLSFFSQFPNNKRPVLGINLSESPGFLTEIPINRLNDAIQKIKNNEFSVENIIRIKVITNHFTAYALNEVAIFPSKSATLMEYELWIDEEMVWRDYSDGVIIATPIGSTAYAMSAGGAFISPKARVFEIVSVNSMDISRRPIIVPCNSVIEIKNISCRYSPEIVIDGSIRHVVRGSVTIKKSEIPARFIKIDRAETIHDRIRKKIELSKEILDLPPSAKFVLKILEYEGALSQSDIVNKTLLPSRTVRYALSLLLKRGLIREKELLGRDARRKIYYIPPA